MNADQIYEIIRPFGYATSAQSREIACAIETALALATPQPAPAQGVSDAWLPIETAPKDRSILIYTGAGIVEAIWDRRWEQLPCYATYDGCGGVALECQPTHWMPLPVPPVARSAQTNGGGNG